MNAAAVLALVDILCGAPAPKTATAGLVRTRQVLQAISHSFVGEPTRTELMQGALSALVRLSPGTEVKERPATVVTVASGKKKLAFNTAEMDTDAEVAVALERAQATFAPGLDLVLMDEAMASGMVNALADRHSAYLRPYYMQRLGYSEGETLGDPGIEVVASGSRTRVKAVAPGSSAALAGVQARQIVRRVDAHNLDGLSIQEVGALLLGPAGSKLEVVLEPAAGGDPTTLELTRDPPFALQPRIKVIKDVLHVVPGPLLGGASRAVRAELEKTQNLKGVVLDFRGNSGGQVGDAVALADLFVKEGPLAQVISRANRPVQRFEAQAGDPGEGLPVVVLMDGRTASAAELASLALRERMRTPLLGAQSFGKGSVQKLIPIEGGGMLKITSAMYMTPAGTTVGDGILPDVTLDPATTPRRGQEGNPASDAWLAAALDVLLNPANKPASASGKP